MKGNDRRAGPAFALAHGGRRVPLREGTTLIGRGAECDVVLDSQLVSRKHARVIVSDGVVLVEDLGSDNGVRVEGDRIRGKILLSPCMRLTIADAVLTLTRDDAPTRDSSREDTSVDVRPRAPEADLTTRRTHAFQLMAGVVDKALALGRTDEAEHLMDSLLQDVLKEAQKGAEVPPDIAEGAAKGALKLAHATARAQWADYPIRLYLALGKVAPLELVDELIALGRRVPRMDRASIERYASRLEAMKLAPRDRFVLQRVHGLARMLRSVGSG